MFGILTNLLHISICLGPSTMAPCKVQAAHPRRMSRGASPGSYSHSSSVLSMAGFSCLRRWFYRQTGNPRGDKDETQGISTEAVVNPFPQSLLSQPTDLCLWSEVELGIRDLEWGVGFQKPYIGTKWPRCDKLRWASFPSITCSLYHLSCLSGVSHDMPSVMLKHPASRKIAEVLWSWSMIQ